MRLLEQSIDFFGGKLCFSIDRNTDRNLTLKTIFQLFKKKINYFLLKRLKTKILSNKHQLKYLLLHFNAH